MTVISARFREPHKTTQLWEWRITSLHPSGFEQRRSQRRSSESQKLVECGTVPFEERFVHSSARDERERHRRATVFGH